MDKKRIWELDFLRGLFILCMVAIHAIYDFRVFLGWQIKLPGIYDVIQENGGILFILISGICATLGSRFMKRGILVFGCGLLVSAVTFGMAYFQMISDDTIIYWGILHLLGFCMVVYGLLRRLPVWALFLAAAGMIGLGFYLETIEVNTWYFCFLGLTPYGFATGDYFPVFPNLGWFTLGIAFGRIFYKEKTTLLPKVPERFPPIRFLSFCGRHSLWIYLIHQPILYGLTLLLA